MLKARGGDRCRAVVLFTSHPSVGKTAIWSHFLAPRCSNAACTQPFTPCIALCSRVAGEPGDSGRARRPPPRSGLLAAPALLLLLLLWVPVLGRLIPGRPAAPSASLLPASAAIGHHRVSSGCTGVLRRPPRPCWPLVCGTLRPRKGGHWVSLHNASRGGSGTTSAHPPPPGHAHSCPLPLFNHARPLTTMILVVTPESALRGT